MQESENKTVYFCSDENVIPIEVGKVYTPSDFKLYVCGKELVGWDSLYIDTSEDEGKEK
ncbi:hypothetical protein [Pseudoalteromonas phage PH357]|nr:hypothetical protein [Pseudoalteromonas phage PH357]